MRWQNDQSVAVRGDVHAVDGNGRFELEGYGEQGTGYGILELSNTLVLATPNTWNGSVAVNAGALTVAPSGSLRSRDLQVDRRATLVEASGGGPHALI